MPLSDVAIRNTKPIEKTQRLFDGRGLYLEIAPSGGKWWRLKYRYGGKEKRLSLGTYPDTGLRDAREKCDSARRLLAQGIDPSEQRKAEKVATRDRSANTFEAIAREWLARQTAHEWVTSQTVKETRNLEKHVFPWIGSKPIDSVGVSNLSPIVLRLADAGSMELAHRLRATLSRIFVYAAATERLDSGSNPAAPLKAIMPTRRPSKKMPTITDPEKIGELLRAIDSHKGTFVVGCAVKLSAMLACRPGEIRQAEWAHVNLEGEAPAITLPPSIRKLRRALKEHPETQGHVVPLATQAVAILRELRVVTGTGRYIFPGARDRNRPMSEAAVTAALARLGYKGELVAHGFRHMASTRLNEMGWNPDAVERQLSHKDKDKIRGTYNLAQYLAERHKMMQAWADYLDTLRVGSKHR